MYLPANCDTLRVIITFIQIPKLLINDKMPMNLHLDNLLQLPFKDFGPISSISLDFKKQKKQCHFHYTSTI